MSLEGTIGCDEKPKGKSIYSTPLACISASLDGTAKVWCAKSGKCKKTLSSETDGMVCSVKLSPTGLSALTLCLSGRGLLYDIDTGKLLCSLSGTDTDPVNEEVAFSADGCWIAGALDEGVVRVWNAKTGEAEHTFAGHDDIVSFVCFSPDGRLLLSASLDNTACIWAMDGSSPRRVLMGHLGAVKAADFSPDGLTVATASEDGTAMLWSTASGQCLHTLRGHSKTVNAVRFSPHGQVIATASVDGFLCTWYVETGTEKLCI